MPTDKKEVRRGFRMGGEMHVGEEEKSHLVLRHIFRKWESKLHYEAQIKTLVRCKAIRDVMFLW